jgi:hypothetical protein
VFDQSSRYRVAVDVSQLLSPFGAGEDIEVVVPDLPEGFLFRLLGDRGFERLHGAGERCARWFGDEQVDVFRHDDVSEDVEDIALTNLFEGLFETVAGFQGGEVGRPVVTAEGEEMEIT